MLSVEEERSAETIAFGRRDMRAGRLFLLFQLLMVLAFVASGARGASVDEKQAGLPELARELSTWITRHTEYPEPPLPELRFESQTGLEELCFPGFSHDLLPRIRGAYDARSEVIYLNHDLDPTDSLDLSYLLHELVHHFQTRSAGNNDRRLKSVKEAEALRLQLRWLEENGVQDGMEKLGVDERSLRMMETSPRHYPYLEGVKQPVLTLACR